MKWPWVHRSTYDAAFDLAKHWRDEYVALRDRYDALVDKYVARGDLPKPETDVPRETLQPPARLPEFPDDPPEMAMAEVAPSLEVVIEEFADASHAPSQVRRQLFRFAALKRTQGHTEEQIVALIRKGGEVPDDEDAEDGGFV